MAVACVLVTTACSGGGGETQPTRTGPATAVPSASPSPTASVATSEDDFIRYCGRTGAAEPLTGQPAYRGKGPHPVHISSDEQKSLYPAPTASSSASPQDPYRPQPQKAQLVACVHDIGTGPLLQTCHYSGGFTMYWRQGKFEITVYEARSGRAVGTTKILGISHITCDPTTLVFDQGEQTKTGRTMPSLTASRKALSRWVEADR